MNKLPPRTNHINSFSNTDNYHHNHETHPDLQSRLPKQAEHHQQIMILPNKNISQAIYSCDSESGMALKDPCKRVGSLKVENKKVKSNVSRSKSDPEPDEIKSAMSSSVSYDTDSYRLEPENDPTNASSYYETNNQLHTLSHSRSITTGESPISTNTAFSFTPSTTNSSLSSSRQSWMNGSDIELEEELPPLSIDRSANGLHMSDKDIKTQEVINELIHTEQKHVRNLKIMKHHFYLPIKVNMYLTKEELNVMFPNLEQVLELHSSFNNKLKRLRKENPIVPVKQLINVILEQFKGERGEKFKIECARFCENQSQAMRLLQSKLKTSEKFNSFISSAENHSICRKLQLKDFLPTEVQRLVKYKLLFQELTKNVTNPEDRERLLECMDASSEISQYINKAVTECENRKRVEEIQTRMDTKEFDQYCVKSPLLVQYKNLDLRSRKLIYEGELEWKIHGSVRLMALLFEDILVFLERVASSTNSSTSEDSDTKTRRYSLRPLVYTINKTKQMFTPVIPLNCINNFRPMHEKRYFHLVVIIQDEALKGPQKSSHIQTQMLFILIAKSGDERNKWVNYLQALTGKLSQTDKQNTHIDLRQPNQQSSTSSLTSLATTNSSSAASSTVNLMGITAPSIKTSVSASALLPSNSLHVTPINESFDSKAEELGERKSERGELNANTYLEDQLKENTDRIFELLRVRQDIISRIAPNGFESNIDSSNQSDDPINNLLGSLTSLSQNLIEETKRLGQNPNTALTSSKLLGDLLKVEQYVLKLRPHLAQINNRLPSLQLPSANSNDLEAEEVNVKNDIRSFRSPSSKAVRQMMDSSELVSSSLFSSAASSSNADLSEDEQINYYEDEDNNPIMDEDYGTRDVQAANLASNNRSLSTSSDQTLVLMNGNEIISAAPKPRIATIVDPQSSKKTYCTEGESSRDIAYDTEEEVKIETPFQFDYKPHKINNLDQSVVIKLNRSPRSVDEAVEENNRENLISIEIHPKLDDELDLNRNDLSDDEVKEYTSYDQSHV